MGRRRAPGDFSKSFGLELRSRESHVLPSAEASEMAMAMASALKGLSSVSKAGLWLLLLGGSRRAFVLGV